MRNGENKIIITKVFGSLNRGRKINRAAYMRSSDFNLCMLIAHLNIFNPTLPTNQNNWTV